MFNEASEIVDLINLLRLNDKRPLLKKKDIFTKKGQFKSPDSIKLFTNGSKGYISYLRGEHPGKFPKRLYPDAVPTEEFLLILVNSQSMIFLEKNSRKGKNKKLKR